MPTGVQNIGNIELNIYDILNIDGKFHKVGILNINNLTTTAG